MAAEAVRLESPPRRQALQTRAALLIGDPSLGRSSIAFSGIFVLRPRIQSDNLASFHSHLLCAKKCSIFTTLRRGEMLRKKK